MMGDFVFSWAEDEDGKIVHVDSVPNGKLCRCRCPYCHESLVAKQGDIREHGFAHNSKDRQANLSICYKVTLYKLAEQIIYTKKQICVPSYYGIFKQRDLKFKEVQIDGRYQRDDRQPDVTATSQDDKKYLIEFVYNNEPLHKLTSDFSGLSCLKIDLSHQKLESLEDFLLKSADNRKWLNNRNDFERIEDTYQKANKPVKLVCTDDCKHCTLINECCAVMVENKPIEIKESGKMYRICKRKLYDKIIGQKAAIDVSQKRELVEPLHTMEIHEIHEDNCFRLTPERPVFIKKSHRNPAVRNKEKSCFDCSRNLEWKNIKNRGFANCGMWETLSVSKKTPPKTAINCSSFDKKQK
jgi:hypothetical protein